MLVCTAAAGGVPGAAMAQAPATDKPATDQSDSDSGTAGSPNSEPAGSAKPPSAETDVAPAAPTIQTDVLTPVGDSQLPNAAGLKDAKSDAEASNEMTPEQYCEQLMKDPEYVAELDKRAAAY